MAEMRVGIVGCGDIARYHIQGYQAAGAEITAFADVNLAAAEAMAGGIPGAKAFPDHQALIDSGRVDLISICTPPAYHEEAAVYALKRGVHVLCEKPFAHTLESARRMAEAAEGSSALMMCAFRHRFLPAVNKLKELVPEIGPLVCFNNLFGGPLFRICDKWFSKRVISGGGALIDTATHSIDLFRFLVGEIAEQQALTHRHLENIEVEDAGVLTVKGESGAVGSIIATWVAGTGLASIDLVGQKGRLFFDYMRNSEVRMAVPGEAEWRTIPVEPSSGFKEQIAHFLGAVRGEWPLSCTVEDAMRVMEVLDAIYREEVVL
jgi:predicted dehydrogenase